MKRVLLAIALVCAVAVPSFAQSVVVAGTKVLDNTGAPLVSGQWCLGTSCLTVTNGAFSGSVTAATASITVINGATTYLTIPSVTIAGSYFSWDTYVVPSNASISGIGTPRIACTPGAIYTQTDGGQNKWQCNSLNGAGVWSGLPNPGTPWTVTVGSTNTLPAGSPATVTNSGNANAAILNFGLPRGAQGIPALLGMGQGAWASGTTYSEGDVVNYSGNSYASFSNSNLGHEPDTSPTFWGMLANLNNLPAAFASQSAANPQAGTFTTVAAGTLILSYATVTNASYSATTSFAYLLADCTANNITISLPPASTGVEITVVKIDASGNSVTVQAIGSDKILGSTAWPAFSQRWESVKFKAVTSSGSSFWIVG